MSYLLHFVCIWTTILLQSSGNLLTILGNCDTSHYQSVFKDSYSLYSYHFSQGFQGLNKAYDKHCQEPNKGLTFQGHPKQTFRTLRRIKAAWKNLKALAI